MNDPMIQKLEALAKEMEDNDELSATVRLYGHKLRALIAEEGKAPQGTIMREILSDVRLPKVVYERGTVGTPLASAGTPHMCPVKHGAEREMELQWVCETCGHREDASAICDTRTIPAGTEGLAMREVAELARRGKERSNER